MFKRRVLLFSLLLGILIWIFDALLDYVVFYRGSGSFLDLLLLDVPPHELYIRILIILLLFSAGLFLVWFTARTQHNLFAGENWFSTTLMSIGDAVITADVNGHITFLNKVAGSLTGWERDAAIGRPVSEVFRIVQEGTNEPVEDPVSRILREGRIIGLANHIELIALDGTRRAIEDSGAPIRQGGEIIGAVLVFHDTTEQRMNQRIIEQSEQQLTALLNNLPGMAYRCRYDDGWYMEYVNENCIELTGYEPKEFLTERRVRHRDLIADKDFERVTEILKISIEVGKPFSIMYRLLTAEGTEKWVLDSGEPVLSGEGETLEIEGFITDITEQRHVYERYRALFQSLQDAIIVTNDKREIIDCNEAFLELFGYDFDEIYGTTTSVIYASDAIYTEIGRHVEDFSKDDYFSTDIICERKDKSQFRAELSVGYLHDYLGNRMGNVGVIRDLTKQEIMEQELIHAQKMEALGQMAGGIAHDFNNVIASVSGAVQMLELKLQDESLKKYLDIIKSSVERGNSVTSRMLTFTRSEQPEIRPLSLIEF
ncbi:MAG: PAS domain S-box protein, partial [Candidatus Marinimicrobia bacterium]|nr:PAS domain S-box protein [Candidatus Neomarinimicrobiota bacterium]